MSESLSGYKIGFIGLGNMGWPMAGHLQDSGADIVVWNRSDEPKQRAAERAMLVATDAEALAGVVGDGVICLNLTHSDVVTTMVEVIEPALASGVTVIDFGTTGYEETLGFAAKLREKGGAGLMLRFQVVRSELKREISRSCVGVKRRLSTE